MFELLCFEDLKVGPLWAWWMMPMQCHFWYLIGPVMYHARKQRARICTHVFARCVLVHESSATYMYSTLLSLHEEHMHSPIRRVRVGAKASAGFNDKHEQYPRHYFCILARYQCNVSSVWWGLTVRVMLGLTGTFANFHQVSTIGWEMRDSGQTVCMWSRRLTLQEHVSTR